VMAESNCPPGVHRGDVICDEKCGMCWWGWATTRGDKARRNIKKRILSWLDKLDNTNNG